MDIQNLIDNYASWLKSEITFDKIGEYYEITTPFINHSNDYLQIYIKQNSNDEIFFSDDGATIQELLSNGIPLTHTRKKHIQAILFQYGVELSGKEIIARAPARLFAQKKHMFIQAMLRIDDMYSLSKAKVESCFTDDIQCYFQKNHIFYVENVQLAGLTGYSHNFDFIIQRSNNKPERLCQAMNTPSKSNVGNILFAWNDTKSARKNQSQLIIFANDSNGIPSNIEDAFNAYDAKVIKWSERNNSNNIDLLTA